MIRPRPATSQMQISQALTHADLTGMPRRDFQALVDQIAVPTAPPSSDADTANEAARSSREPPDP
jgi:hypothetical protein